jgi:hypothetical protein
MVVMQSERVLLTFVCPDCGEPLPVPVNVRVEMCECGLMHQSISLDPDVFEVEHHMVLHEGDV